MLKKLLAENEKNFFHFLSSLRHALKYDFSCEFVILNKTQNIFLNSAIFTQAGFHCFTTYPCMEYILCYNLTQIMLMNQRNINRIFFCGSTTLR